MPLTHLYHPEDLILTGNTWVVDAMFGADDPIISLKMDGSVALVWGIHPQNGKFFVGTKSVFNKVKKMIAYTHDDINTYYGKYEEVNDLLHECLDFLPRVPGVFQGDFIGFGGDTTYTPNTLTYKFPERVQANIIIAPHTEYVITGEMHEAEAMPITRTFESNESILWVQPFVDRVPLTDIWHVDSHKVEFLTEKEAYRARTDINALVASGQKIDIDTLTDIIGDRQLAVVYKLVWHLKRFYLANTIAYGAPATYLNGEKVLGEGLTITTENGMFKVVDREQFSFANFNSGRF